MGERMGCFDRGEQYVRNQSLREGRRCWRWVINLVVTHRYCQILQIQEVPMSRYQKYQTDQYLPSFRKQGRNPPSIRQQQPNYSSYSQQPYRHKARTQQSKHNYQSKYRDYSPQPGYTNSRVHQNKNNNHNHYLKPKDNGFSVAASGNYDLTSSSVSALTSIGRSNKKSYPDNSDTDKLSKSYARVQDNQFQNKQYDKSPIKEGNQYGKQRYNGYVDEYKAGRGKQDDDYLSKSTSLGQPKSRGVELIPHKSNGYGEEDYSSKYSKQGEYRSGDFKKNKSRYQDTFQTSNNHFKDDYKAGYKAKYKDQLVGESKQSSYKSQIRDKYSTGDYSSYKADARSDYKTDYISEIKNEINAKSEIKQDTYTNSSYSKPKQYSDKAEAYHSVLSEKERIKQAKKKYMDEMKSKISEVNSLISKSKELHLENQKTLSSFSYLMKPKVVYQKIKFIADIRDFQLGKQKGEGKFGTVHQAIHKSTQTLYAIKKIPKETIKTYMLENQLALQIQIQSYVSHPNILKIYGFFDDWQYVYIVLEYMEQGTLFQYLRKKNNSKLPEKDVAKKIKEITEAIKYLHDMDIAHRDIKPENIVLSYGVAKLCDFGWSTRCKDRRQTYCGTFDYAAPQMLQGKQYNETVDLWCLGILTYELLFGKSPFYHLSKQETKKKVLRVDRDQIEFPKDIDASWKARDFIQSLLKKDPNDRRRVESLITHPFLTDSL